jgi:hypothetical protein
MQFAQNQEIDVIKDASGNFTYHIWDKNFDVSEIEADLISDGFSLHSEGIYAKEVNNQTSGIHQFAFICKY